MVFQCELRFKQDENVWFVSFPLLRFGIEGARKIETIRSMCSEVSRIVSKHHPGFTVEPLVGGQREDVFLIDASNIDALVGFIVKQARTEASLSTYELCDRTSISLSTLSRIERGTNSVDFKLIDRIMRAIGGEKYRLIISNGIKFVKIAL